MRGLGEGSSLRASFLQFLIMVRAQRLNSYIFLLIAEEFP